MNFDGSESSLLKLEEHFTDNSYVDGSVPSQADVKLIKSFKNPPQQSKYPNTYRWFAHIQTYSKDYSALQDQVNIIKGLKICLKALDYLKLMQSNF